LKGKKPGLFVNFGQFPCSWIRIRISNTDPDQGQPNECGPRRIGSTILAIARAYYEKIRQNNGSSNIGWTALVKTFFFIEKV
jgi:hypothetical protein